MAPTRCRASQHHADVVVGVIKAMRVSQINLPMHQAAHSQQGQAFTRPGLSLRIYLPCCLQADVCANLFAMLCCTQEELADAQSQLETLVGPYTEAANLNIANLTGVNLSAVTEKVQAAGLQLGKSAFETLSTFAIPEKVRPGRDLREAGLRPKHPVIIIPGAALASCCLHQLDWLHVDCPRAPTALT